MTENEQIIALLKQILAELKTVNHNLAIVDNTINNLG